MKKLVIVLMMLLISVVSAQAQTDKGMKMDEEMMKQMMVKCQPMMKQMMARDSSKSWRVFRGWFEARV
jgi:ribosomal protein L22